MTPVGTRAAAVLLLAGSVLTCASTGCGWMTKVQECNRVIETINRGSPAIKNFDPARDLEAQAVQLEELEKQVAAVVITDTQLVADVADYRKMLVDMAALVRAYGDPTQFAALEQRNKDMVATEGALVTRINGYCSR
jgi:hypothetical protein